VKRGTPETGSVPTVATSRPRQAATTPFSSDPPESEAITERLAQEHIAAAAGRGVRHQGDRIDRVALLRAGARAGQAGADRGGDGKAAADHDALSRVAVQRLAEG
jgi:hypothetical protein